MELGGKRDRRKREGEGKEKSIVNKVTEAGRKESVRRKEDEQRTRKRIWCEFIEKTKEVEGVCEGGRTRWRIILLPKER